MDKKPVFNGNLYKYSELTEQIIGAMIGKSGSSQKIALNLSAFSAFINIQK